MLQDAASAAKSKSVQMLIRVTEENITAIESKRQRFPILKELSDAKLVNIAIKHGLEGLVSFMNQPTENKPKKGK